MKKLSFIFCLLLIVSSFVSCKKGSEDPAFSFRTRKNRVVGAWSIKSGRYTYEAKDLSGTLVVSDGYKYSEKTYEYVPINAPAGVVYTGGHAYNLTFRKNGTFVLRETFDGFVTTYMGRWDFNQGVGDAKAKEQINLHYDSVENYTGTKTYKGNQTNATFSIIELRNKKMKISLEDYRANPDGSSDKYSEFYELEQ
ncbi:MAG TPA: hypothetical protein VGF30_05625 [Bacteroidia bacterium]